MLSACCIFAVQRSCSAAFAILQAVEQVQAAGWLADCQPFGCILLLILSCVLHTLQLCMLLLAALKGDH